MRKKAQIGETITWFAAFAIIFFIMMLFTFITVFISLKNPVSPDSIGNKEANANKDIQILLSFLDSKTTYNSEDIKVKGLIGEYYKSPNSEIQLKLDVIFSGINNGIYNYDIIISKEGIQDKIEISNIFTSEANILKLEQSRYKLSEEIKIRDENEFYLPSSIGKIKINYFLEEKLK